MRRAAILGLVAFLILGLAGLALAKMPHPKKHHPAKIKAHPFVVDPTASGLVSAAWAPHQGLQDAGKSNHALMLEMEDGAPAGALAGAAIRGVKGLTLDTLGFSVRQGALCSANAPRFVVKLASGDTFLFQCASGAHTAAGTDPQGNAWDEVLFADANAAPVIPPVNPPPPAPVWPGFGVAVVDSMIIVVDEVGAAWLDNINVNGIIIKKPGNAR